MNTRPEILLHPQIPKPLHGIAPRVVMGHQWWDKVRREAYRSTDYHCLACGVSKEDALFHHWMEAHELYSYDWEKGELVMQEIVPLCHACHNFIHSGRMQHMLAKGEINVEFYRTVIEHGERVLDAVPRELRLQSEAPLTMAAWKDWHMVIDGFSYGPSTQSYEEWEEGKWRDWKPPGA